jgi:hypothetical protein
MTMKRILLACVLFLACQKPADQKAAEEKPRQLTEAPPPPALEIARAKEPDDDKGFKVAAGRPQGKLTGTARPTITFSEPVVALETLSQQDPATQIRIEPAVKGRWHWLGSSSVEFVNDEPFPFSTAFHVIVPAGFKALDGTPLANAWQLDFTTPTLEVGRYNVIPVAYACKWSVPAQHFVIPVNQPIRDPEKAFFFEAGDEKRMVAAKVIGSAPADNGVKYEIAPAQDLPRDARFAVGLDGDAHGTQGPLPAGTEWRQECRTMGAMAIVRVTRCFDKTEHCTRGPISIEFTNPLGSAVELKQRLHVTPDPQLEWDDAAGPDSGARLQGNRTQAAIFGKFRPGATYAVHVDAGVKDEQGQEAKAFDATVQLDDLFPSLYVGQRTALLEPSGDGQLPVQVTNLTSLEADLWALTPQRRSTERRPGSWRSGCVRRRPTPRMKRCGCWRRSPTSPFTPRWARPRVSPG